MGEKEYAKIISKNLKRIMYDAGKTQAEVSKDLKISKATISSWMNGTRIPRMDKIDLLCNYFNVSRADIMEEHPQETPYYINPETMRIAQKIYDNKYLRGLFYESEDASPETLQTTHDMLALLKKRERGDE